MFSTLAFFGDAANDCELHLLALDGVYLPAPRPQRSLVLASGGRATVSVGCRVPGSYSFGTVDGAEALGGLFAGEGHAAAILQVNGPGASSSNLVALPVQLPGPPPFYADLTEAEPAGWNTILMSNHSGANIVNGWPYNGSVSSSAVRGSVQEWQVFGGEGEALQNQHPYHQHMTHFQVIAVHAPVHILGDPQQPGSLASRIAMPGEWRETLPLYRELNYTVRFVSPFLGLMMVHCHVVRHSDLGMMTLVNFTDVPGQQSSEVGAIDAAEQTSTGSAASNALRGRTGNFLAKGNQ